jgi:hypothetical protein
MALPAIIDSVEGLVADVAKEYKLDEKSKKYVLDVTAVGGLELADTKGLKTALETERASVKTLKGQVKDFEGLDAAAARDALNKVEEMKNWKPDDKVKGMIDAAKSDMAKAHKAEIDARDARVKKLDGALQKNLVIATASKAITDAKGSIALLMPHVSARVRLREDGDNYLAEVVDEAGNARVGDSSGSPMTIAQFVEELRNSTDYARAFEASGAAGTGASGGNGGAGNAGGTSGGKLRIKSSDQEAINKYSKEIATGKAEVIEG